MRGNFTSARYSAEIVHVYHFSELSFVYMQRGQTSAELTKSKTALRTSPNFMAYKYKAIMQTTGDLLTMLSLKTPTVKTHATVE